MFRSYARQLMDSHFPQVPHHLVCGRFGAQQCDSLGIGFFDHVWFGHRAFADDLQFVDRAAKLRRVNGGPDVRACGEPYAARPVSRASLAWCIGAGSSAAD